MQTHSFTYRHPHTTQDCQSSHLLIGPSTSLKTFVSCHLSPCLGLPPPHAIPVSPYSTLIRLQHLSSTGTTFLHTHADVHTQSDVTLLACGVDTKDWAGERGCPEDITPQVLTNKNKNGRGKCMSSTCHLRTWYQSSKLSTLHEVHRRTKRNTWACCPFKCIKIVAWSLVLVVQFCSPATESEAGVWTPKPQDFTQKLSVVQRVKREQRYYPETDPRGSVRKHPVL